MSAAKKVAVIDDPVGHKGVLFASERYVERAPSSKPVHGKPCLKITLYPPYGEPEEYYECTVLSGLMPELEFKGSRKGRSSFLCRESHITSTTLSYKIEALTNVIN